jgi:hypothetical protein
MKNIHVLPTDKPSKLFKDDFGKYFISINIDQEQNHFKPQHIYITSDEEIKEKTLIFCSKENRVIVNQYHTNIPITYKKIILTTDQDLINDGVQAIDDEFLEWFVKNPSCEEIEIEKYFHEVGDAYDYEIIIPQEESKQETLEEVAKEYASRYGEIDIVINKAVRFGAKWQEERMYSEEEVQLILSKLLTDIKNGNAGNSVEWFEQFKKKGGDK